MRAYYLRGMARMRMGRLDKAAVDLKRVYDFVKYDDLRIKAADALGEVRYLQGRMADAEELFREVLDDTDRDKHPCDHAGYRLGCILQRQGKWAESRTYYRRVLYDFKGSDLAARARKRSTAAAWTIQAGAYENRKNAEDASGRFTKTGLQIAISPELRNSRELVYLLLIGRWKRYQSASGSLPAVRKIEPEAFLTVTR